MTKPTHDVLLAENYTDGQGEEKSYFTNIGSGWATQNGGISIELRAGLAVSGRVLIMPKKDKQPPPEGA